jgi:two-component system chemotaxis response regulator CheY
VGVCILRDNEQPVLVVDDYASMRRILRALLAHLGFKFVQEAENGTCALEKMRERKIGLVIADLDMDFLKAIRAHALLKDTPVIVMSGEPGQEWIRAAKDAGASGYLIKPFNADSLKQKIDAVLATV